MTSADAPQHWPPAGDDFDDAPDDAWIGVHVLTEFVFCPRAGLIAHDSKADDSGDEYWLRPNLDFQPCYELLHIEHQLQQQLNQFWWSCGILVLLLLAAGTAFLLQYFRWMIPPGLALLFLSVRMRDQLNAVLRSLELRREALAPRGAEPDPRHDTPQAVNWWQLLQAGFQSVSYPEPLRDESLRLAGRPWRILRKGDWRIPVFRTWPQREMARPQLYPQHFVRMEAYGHLLEHCEGGETPYGVILFGDSFDGMTVPLDAAGRQRFHEALSQAHSILRQSKQQPQKLPPAPARSWCLGCPHGVPRIYRSGASDVRRNRMVLNPYLAPGLDQKTHHSVCGDWFQWIPPHDSAVRLGLVSSTP